jgi:Mrp family chromosome partitioning ATPase
MNHHSEVIEELYDQVGRKDEFPSPLVLGSEALPASTSPASGLDEEALRLVRRVFLTSPEASPRQVMFCSVDGKGFSAAVCANAARALASVVSKPVCVIDGNLRSPSLSDHLGIDKGSAIFNDHVSPGRKWAKVGSNLWFVGPQLIADQSGSLLPQERLRETMAQLREVFDFALIDAPGTNLSDDTSTLGKFADAAILVIDATHTRRLAARKAVDSLESAGVRVIGTVLCNRSFPIPERIYRHV